MSFSSYQFGPKHTPRPLKYLIWITLFVSLFAAVTEQIFPYYLGWATPGQLLSLSAKGVENLYLWQFVTYLFVQPSAQGISFFFLLSLTFNTYLLWIIGVSLIEKRGIKHFLSLYFVSGIISGTFIYFFQTLTHSSFPFGGNGTALYTLLIAWLTLFPGAEFLLFMLIPMRASWLILGLLSINILIALSNGDLIYVLALLSASGCGYLYSKLLMCKNPQPPLYSRAKKFDLKTGKPILNDEEFMDEMLTKISLKGRSSLTLRERWRLRRISQKKQQ